MNDIKKLLKNFFNSASGNILGQIVNFFTLMYLPRVLGPNGYGIFNFVQSYSMYFLLLSDLGVSLYCIKKINQSKKNIDIIKKVFGIKFIISIISTIVFFVTINFISKSNLELSVLYGIGLSILFSGISVDYLFNAFNDMKYVGISMALKNIIFFIMCITLVKNESQIYLVSICYTIGIIIASLFLIIKFNKKYFRLNIEIPKIKDFSILKESLPLAISLFMVQINNNFDILYLSFTKNQDIVGYYSAPYKIINFLIAILCMYFSSAYPTIAKLISNKKDLNKYIERFYAIGISFVIPVVVGGVIFSEQIINLLFGSSYRESQVIFILLLPLILVRMITSTYGAVLIMGNGSRYFSKGVIIGAVINIILNIFLIPNFNAIGAAVATLISEILQGIYLYVVFRVFCKSKLLKTSILAIIASLGMMIMLFIFNNDNLFIGIILGAISYIIFIFIIYIIIFKDIRRKVCKKIKFWGVTHE